MTTIIGALLGLVVASGVVCFVAGARGVTLSTGRRPRPGAGWVHAGVDAAQLRRVAIALAVAVSGYALSGWLAVGVIGGGAVWIVPHTIATRHAVAVDRERLRALAGWIEVIRDLFGSGAGIEDALVTSQRHVAHAIAADVSELNIAMKVHGSRAALVPFGERFADPIADQVVWALLIATERSSASVSEVLSQAAARARERVATQERLDAKRSSRYLVINTMVAMTVLLGAALIAINPAYRTYYASNVGQVALSVIVVGQGIGFVWLLRMSRHRIGHRIAVSDAIARGW